MIERTVDVKTVLVHADCECGGEMKPTGEALMCYPPKYVHICNQCGNHMNCRERYPVTRMVPVNVDA